MMSYVHNTLALVAILSVALLGVIAIGQGTNSKIETMREYQVSACLRQNETRAAANIEADKIRLATDALRGALAIAESEAGQRTKDRVSYARLQAMLPVIPDVEPFKLIDCEKEVPKP